MKNKIICLVLSLVLVGGLVGANGAYAWFVSSSGGASGGAGAQHLFTTGNVGYTLVGDLAYPEGAETIIPEDELLVNLADEEKLASDENCKMYLSNTSSVDSQLRIKIVYDYGDVRENVYTSAADAKSPLTVEFADGATWTFDNGYFYYGTYDSEKKSSSVISAYVIPEDGTESEPEVIPLFNSIRYSGENTESSAISGKTLNVKVIFEARQSEYVDWVDVGTIYTKTTPETE